MFTYICYYVLTQFMYDRRGGRVWGDMSRKLIITGRGLLHAKCWWAIVGAAGSGRGGVLSWNLKTM